MVITSTTRSILDGQLVDLSFVTVDEPPSSTKVTTQHLKPDPYACQFSQSFIAVSHRSLTERETNVAERLQQTQNTLSSVPWLSQSLAPLNEFTTERFITMTFPTNALSNRYICTNTIMKFVGFWSSRFR